MEYKILSTRQIKETLFTTVEFTFEFGSEVVEIPHNYPETYSEEAFHKNIEQNIKNVADSLIAKEAKSKEIENKLPTIEIGITKSLD
jgi:hypothetical protein